MGNGNAKGYAMTDTSTQKAYDEGMTAACYSLGLSACKYAFGTNEFQAWLNGYRYHYTNN